MRKQYWAWKSKAGRLVSIRPSKWEAIEDAPCFGDTAHLKRYGWKLVKVKITEVTK